MPEKYFEDFIHLPYVTLKTLGYDFLDKPKPFLLKMLMNLYLFLSVLCITYCTYFVAHETLKEMMADEIDLPLVLRLFNDLNYNIIGILKSFFFVRNVTAKRKLFKQFQEIFPKSVEDRLAYRVNENYWPRWITGILYMYFGAVGFILFSPLAQSILEYIIDVIRFGYPEANFAYYKLYQDQSYVIDHRNPLAYILIYSLEALNGHYAIIFNICPDIWLVSYIIQLCMHFDFISRSLENYEPRDKNNCRDSEFLTSIIEKHQMLLELARDLKDIYSSLVLVMLFSTVGTLFCAGVYLTRQGVNRDLFGYLAFLPTSLGQYYMVCYYGQELINKSSAVGLAAYNQRWYNGYKTYKKSVLVVLERAQLECEINAGGFQTTNLESFEWVIQMTFQLFTVWRSVMAKKGV